MVAGNNAGISAINNVQNDGQNSVGAVLGNVSDQIGFLGTVTVGDNSFIEAANAAANSGTNAGTIGLVSGSQIIFNDTVSTGINTSIFAFNIIGDSGSNTGIFGQVGSQLVFQGNVNAGPNSTIGAINTGTVITDQILFANSLVSGRPDIFAINIGTIGSGGISFQGSSNTDGALINIHGTTLNVASNASNFTLGGINGDASSSALFNQIVNLNVPQGQSTQFSGPIHDNGTPGGLLKTGQGSQTIGGACDFTGSTTISQGNLILTSTGVLPTDVFIQNGGQLSGNGKISGSVDNQGVIYPGQSVGTLTILDNYTQTNNGTYLLQVSGKVNPNGTGLSSLLAISGSASLGGLVNVISPDNTYAIGREYVILTAAQGFNGTTFAGAITANPFLVPTLIYDPNQSVLLFLATQFIKGAQTENERQIALQLDGISQLPVMSCSSSTTSLL